MSGFETSLAKSEGEGRQGRHSRSKGKKRVGLQGTFIMINAVRQASENRMRGAN